jgi:26S proteasome regulatory subunit T5
MSSAPPPGPNPPPNNAEKKPESESSSSAPAPSQDAAMDTTPDQPPAETWDDIPEDVLALPTDDIATRTRLLDNDIRVRSLLA